MGILKVLAGLGGKAAISASRAFAENPPNPAPAPGPAPALTLPPAAFGGYLNTPGFGPTGVPGTVLLGNPTVFIGG